MLDIFLDTLMDSLRILPFLYITYLIMEYIGHKSNTKMQRIVQNAGRLGPVLGGVAGAFPQCGFSAAASSLYSGNIISMGTLLAIFWSTSDEMLPIMISEQVSIGFIISTISIKVLIGIVFGLVVDLIFKRKKAVKIGRTKIGSGTGTLCENGLCDCKKVIIKGSLRHTAQTMLFIFIVSYVLNILVSFAGEEAIAGIMTNQPVLGPVLAGIIGLIPNCAASVVITQLFLEGMLGFGTMMAGLLVGAGIGILILVRENKNWIDTAKVIGVLYTVGVVVGIAINLIFA